MIEDVRTWLEQGGYLLEMRVALMVKARDAMVEQGYHYTDPTTGQEREGDLTASLHRLHRPDHIHGFELIIECKSTSAPWIVFLGRSDWANNWHPRQLYSHHCGECSDLATDYYALLREAPTGYAMTEKRSPKAKDLAYEALQQVTSATIANSAFRQDPAEQEEEHKNPDHIKALGVPIVVTESPIITCHLDDGVVNLQQRDRATVFVPRVDVPPRHEGDGLEVTVIHEPAFDAYLDKLQYLLDE